MRNCLTDHALFRLTEGDGRPAEYAHVASCLTCAARLRGFEQSVAFAAGALREDPIAVAPPPTMPNVLPITWMPILAMAASLVLALGVARWMTTDNGSPRVPAAAPMHVAALSLTELQQAFAVDDRGGADADFTYLTAALSGSGPCDQPGSSANPLCE